MKYILADTRIVHWDQEGLSRISPDAYQILQGSLTAEMFVVNNNRLPVIIEEQIQVLDREERVFSCIFHTKALLSFDPGENPILDLIRLFDETFIQEEQEWEIKTRDTPLETFKIAGSERDPEARFNRAYQIMEHARKRNLLT
jgi:hypothetical protein